MVLMIMEGMFLIMMVYLIFYILNYKNELDYETSSSYECGFDPVSLTRMSFSYRFFLISILFLIFDVEISILLPIPFLVEGLWSMWIFFMFIMVLLIGLMYEYFYGSLDWMDNFVSKA